MRYFISTGELSGDLHASYLVDEILKLDKEAEIYAIGGKNLRKKGINIFKNIEKLAIMGFIEVIKNFRVLKNTLDETYNFIIENKIDRVILVDYGGFNLKLLERLKKNNINTKIIYYIPPKIWIWGFKRIEKIKLADEILVIFPWEEEFYKKNGVKVSYYGNPFMEKYEKSTKFGNKILLLPGSRKQEIESLIPHMLEIVESLSNESFLLKLPNEEYEKYVTDRMKSYKNLEIKYGITLAEAVKKSKYTIAASGTVILELSILGLPGIAIYKTSILNELIGKFIIKYKFVTLPNLTLDKEVYPELLQRDCNKNRILEEINKLENNREKSFDDIEEVRKALYGENILKSYGLAVVEGTEKNEK
jgi:lipid-A-disaccharide synthase